MVKKIAIITNGAFPVPAVKGGAMETLVEEIVQENERFQDAELTVVSVADSDAEEASRQYHHSAFVFLKASPFLTSLDYGIHYLAENVFHAKNHLAFKTTLQRCGYILSVGKHISKQNYDVLVFENQMAQLWSLKIDGNLHKYKGKYYFHLHNHPARYAHAESMVRNCNSIICVSEFIGRAFASHVGMNYGPEKFSVLKNAIDTDLFCPAHLNKTEIESLRNKYVKKNQELILFTGRMMPGKGVIELIRAFIRMKNQNAVLVVVGSFNFNDHSANPFENQIKIEAAPARDRIVFTGYIDHQQLPGYYAMADFAVLPSTIEEAAGLTVIEAISMHLPLITTTMGGIPEYADDSCALMINNDSQLIDHLAEAMDEMSQNDELRMRLKDGAVKKSGKWTLENYYNKFMKIIGE